MLPYRSADLFFFVKPMMSCADSTRSVRARASHLPTLSSEKFQVIQTEDLILELDQRVSFGDS